MNINVYRKYSKLIEMYTVFKNYKIFEIDNELYFKLKDSEKIYGKNDKFFTNILNELSIILNYIEVTEATPRNESLVDQVHKCINKYQFKHIYPLELIFARLAYNYAEDNIKLENKLENLTGSQNDT